MRKLLAGMNFDKFAGSLIRIQTFLAAAFICGCADIQSISQEEQPWNNSTSSAISKSRPPQQLPCQKFEQSISGRVAFYGIELDDGYPVVIGYFYCNSKSPAEIAGIIKGDRIFKINNCQVNSSMDVSKMIKGTAPKSIVSLEVVRGGSIIPLEIKTIPYRPSNQNLATRNKYSMTCIVD